VCQVNGAEAVGYLMRDDRVHYDAFGFDSGTGVTTIFAPLNPTNPQSVANAYSPMVGAVGKSVSNNSPPPNGTDEYVTHAIMWRNGQTLDLGNVAGDPRYSAEARDVNDAAEVVGWSQITDTYGNIQARATLWIRGTGNFYLQKLADHKVTLLDAGAISCAGHIAAIGYPIGVGDEGYYSLAGVLHSYLLLRVGGPARKCP
jgi:hypothetical protein